MVLCLCRIVEARVEHDAHVHLPFDALHSPMDLVHRGARVVGPRHVVGQAENALPFTGEQRLENVLSLPKETSIFSELDSDLTVELIAVLKSAIFSFLFFTL